MDIFATKIFTFEAAHFLPDYNGKCNYIHGHSYEVHLTMSGDVQADGNEKGMIMDFYQMKEFFQGTIDWLDHSLLTEAGLPAGWNPEIGDKHPQMDRVRVLGFRPTTELLAVWLFTEASRLLSEYLLAKGTSGTSGNMKISGIRINETKSGYIEVHG